MQNGPLILKELRHFRGLRLQPHNANEKWGVLTRTRQSHRTVTMLAAKHGRSVEAITQFLIMKQTRQEHLAKLAQKMRSGDSFPPEFQVLFRMPMVDTEDGPAVKDALIEDVCIPEGSERSESANAG